MELVVLFMKIMLINIILSGDNAIVISMASKKLPEAQRKLAVWWGSLGAVVLRIVLTAAAVVLLDVPFIQAGGSLLLLYIAIKLLLDDQEVQRVKEASNLMGAVSTIIIADFIMSLDNVLAIAAIAQGNYVLMVSGIALSIPLIVWGSNAILKLLHKIPALIYLGAGILGYTAGEMFTADDKMDSWLLHDYDYLHWFIPVAASVLVILVGLIKRWRWLRMV